MTIVVSILCEDGIVIGADGMASLNIGDISFVGTKNNKISVIKDELIISCAGSDELTKKFINFVEMHYSLNYEFIKNNIDNDKNINSLPNFLAHGFVNYYLDSFIKPNQLLASKYNEIVNNGLNFQAAVAYIVNNKHYLCTIDGKCYTDVLRDDGIWHRIFGSGQFVAEPSFHLVRKILNISKKPSVEAAITLAYWTIQHSIDVSSGGIGGDITIKYLKRKDKYLFAISDANVSEQDETLNLFFAYSDSFFKELKNINNVGEIPILKNKAQN